MPLDHLLGDARLRDLKPELEQFSVDAWRAPKPISMLIRRIHTRGSICRSQSLPVETFQPFLNFLMNFFERLEVYFEID